MDGPLPGGGLRPRQLRYVAAVADAGSFRRAAAALGIPARALAREIDAVERALGARLFERRSRVVPTAAGRDVVRIAREAPGRRAEEGRDAARGAATLAVGSLDYGRGQAILRAAIAEFAAQHPHVTVRLAPRSASEEHARAVADGTLAVAFPIGPVAPAPGVASRVLFAESVGCALLPEGHRLADGDAVSLRELGAVPLHTIRAAAAPHVMGAVLDALAHGGWRGRRTPPSSTPGQVLGMVACGAGWAPSSASLLGWAPAGCAVLPLADGPLAEFDLHVTWREDDALATAFAGLVLELRDVLDAAAPAPPAPRRGDAGGGYRALLAQRHAERARIARDLHDTLLQGVLGTQLQLEALRQRLPQALAHERDVVREAVERLGRVGREAREAVQHLRVARRSARDLALALASAGEELREESPVEFRMRTDGTPRALRPDAEEAFYRVGVEALTNAFRHASATLVSVSLDYWDDQFRLRVTDDGAGIEPEVLRAGGRPGHFGLALMRERAAGVGATLAVESRPKAGTTVELSAPGRAAFADRRG